MVLQRVIGSRLWVPASRRSRARTCAGLWIKPHGWKKRHFGRYWDAVEAVQSRGVSVNGCFVVGLDTDTPEIFETVRDFVAQSNLREVQIAVLTPFPGTLRYTPLNGTGRPIRERFRDRCTLFNVNCYPRHMSVKEIEDGMR